MMSSGVRVERGVAVVAGVAVGLVGGEVGEVLLLLLLRRRKLVVGKLIRPEERSASSSRARISGKGVVGWRRRRRVRLPVLKRRVYAA